MKHVWYLDAFVLFQEVTSPDVDDDEEDDDGSARHHNTRLSSHVTRDHPELTADVVTDDI